MWGRHPARQRCGRSAGQSSGWRRRGWFLSPLVNRLLAGFFRGTGSSRLINAYGRAVGWCSGSASSSLCLRRSDRPHLSGVHHRAGGLHPGAGQRVSDRRHPTAVRRSLERTDAVLLRASDTIVKVPGVAHAVGIAGFSGATLANSSNAGAIFATLLPFEERKGRVSALLRSVRICASARQHPGGETRGVSSTTRARPGDGWGLQLEVQDRSGPVSGTAVGHRSARHRGQSAIVWWASPLLTPIPRSSMPM